MEGISTEGEQRPLGVGESQGMIGREVGQGDQW